MWATVGRPSPVGSVLSTGRHVHGLDVVLVEGAVVRSEPSGDARRQRREGGNGPAWSCPRAAGGRLLSSVLIVGVAAAEVEGMLERGVGPGLPEDPRCPVCGERLRGCWRGYRRAVRVPRGGGGPLVSPSPLPNRRGAHAPLPR